MALWTTAQDSSPEPLLFAVLLRPQSKEAVCFLLREGRGETAIRLPKVSVLLYDSAYLMRRWDLAGMTRNVWIDVLLLWGRGEGKSMHLASSLAPISSLPSRSHPHPHSV